MNITVAAFTEGKSQVIQDQSSGSSTATKFSINLRYFYSLFSALFLAASKVFSPTEQKSS